MNWRGRPLTSHEVAVELISATTTQTGMTVHAERDTGTYPKGIKITKAQLAAVPSLATSSTASGTTLFAPNRFHHQRWKVVIHASFGVPSRLDPGHGVRGRSAHPRQGGTSPR